MPFLQDVIKEELGRVQCDIASHEALLASLPKGYLSMQTIGGKAYCYRKHREGSKVVSEYVGPADSSETKKAQSDYQERKRIVAALRTLRKEKVRLVRALRHFENLFGILPSDTDEESILEERSREL